MNAQTKVKRARLWVMDNIPALCVMSQNLQDSFEPRNQTACTDGDSIYWCPQFLEGLTEPQVRGVLLHETGHPALGHIWRFKGKAKEQAAQLACDSEVNHWLSSFAQFGKEIELPGQPFMPVEFAGMVAEQVYARLKNPPQPKKGKGQGTGQGQGQGQHQGQDKEQDKDKQDKADGQGQGQPTPDPAGNGSFCEPQPGKGQTQAEKLEQLKDKWEEAAISAAQAAKSLGCGELPGGIQRLVDAIVVIPNVDWREALSEFFRDALNGKSDWSRQARRHAWQPVVLPNTKADAIGLVIVARDTSGSIGERELMVATACIQELQSETSCPVLLLDVDTDINCERRIEPGQPIPLDAPGGGGTDLRPPFERAKQLAEQGERIAGIIYLTDLDGPTPSKIECPTLWLCVSHAVAPVGKTVRVKV